MEKNILLSVDGVPKVNFLVERKTRIKDIKQILKLYIKSPQAKIYFFVNSKNKMDVFDTEKYDSVNLESVWNVMNQSYIEIINTKNKLVNVLSPVEKEKQFTGNKDVDYKILQMLDDKELGKICSTNSYMKILCSDEHFWRNRTVNKFGEYLGDVDQLRQYKENNQIDSWRNFYISLVNTVEKMKEGIFNFTTDYQLTLLFKQDKYIPKQNYFNNNMIELVLNVVKDKEALNNFMDYMGAFIVNFMLTNPNKYIFDKMTQNWEVEDLLEVLEDEGKFEFSDEGVKMLLDALLKKGATKKDLKDFARGLDPEYEKNKELRKLINKYLK